MIHTEFVTGVVALCEEQHEHAQEPDTVQNGRDGSVSVRAEAVFRGEETGEVPKNKMLPYSFRYTTQFVGRY